MNDCRFKDGELLSEEVTSEGSHLVLDKVSSASTGDYRCRANNDNSAVYSQVAHLQVEGILIMYAPLVLAVKLAMR